MRSLAPLGPDPDRHEAGAGPVSVDDVACYRVHRHRHRRGVCGMNLTMRVGGSSVQVRSRAGTRIHLRLRTAARRGSEIVTRLQWLSVFDLGTSGPPTFSAD